MFMYIQGSMGLMGMSAKVKEGLLEIMGSSF